MDHNPRGQRGSHEQGDLLTNNKIYKPYARHGVSMKNNTEVGTHMSDQQVFWMEKVLGPQS